MDDGLSATKRATDQINDIIAGLKHKKAARLVQQQLAEQQAAVERQQAFEKAWLPTVVGHYEQLTEAGIEARYGVAQYSLYRAVKALTTMQVAAENKQREAFISACWLYKAAMIGMVNPGHNGAVTKRADEGSIGFIEKLDHRHPYLLHYDLNKSEHWALKHTGLGLAQQLNQQAVRILAVAQQQGLISEQDKIEPYDRGAEPKPLVAVIHGITQTLDRKQQYALDAQARYTLSGKNLDTGRGFSR